MSNLFSEFSETEMKYLLLLSQSALHILLILALAWAAWQLSARGIRLLRGYMRDKVGNDLEELKRIETLNAVFGYISSVLITVIAGMLILSEVGISIAPILATAGVLGIAVGFGAQSLIKDYFNGFFLLLENQVRQGDVVEAAGIGGLVEEVTLRHIKMRDYDGNVHFIPNGIITTVTNKSRDYAFAVIDIRVAYRENVDEVMEIMCEVGAVLRHQADFEDKILEDLEMAGVDNMGDAGIIIRCRIKTRPLQQWSVRREFLRQLKHAFEERDIELPYPQMVIKN